MNKESLHKNKLILLHCLFIVLLLLSISTTVRFSSDILDDDASGEMILSDTFRKEKTLVPKDWFFGNEYRINNQLIWGFLLNFIDDWQTARLIGTFIIQLIYLGSFIYMMRSFGFDWERILYGCSLLILPYCVAYGRIVLYHCFYAPHIIFSFLIAGLYFRVVCNHEKTSAILLFLTGFFSCITGFRQLFVTMAPIGIIAFFRSLRVSGRSFWKNRVFLYAVGICLFGLSGIFFEKLVIIPQFGGMSQNGYRLSYKGFHEAVIIVFSILRQFAYRSNISGNLLLKAFSFGGILVFLFGMLESFQGFRSKTFSLFFIRWMLVIQLVLHFLVFLFFDLPSNTRLDYARYLLPASVWIIPLFCLGSERKWKRILYIITQIIFIGNGLINHSYFHDPSTFPQDYDGLPFTDISSAKKYDEIAEFILEKGYDLGYGFENINTFSEKLNGLPIVPIECTEEEIRYRKILTRPSWMQIEGKKVFIYGNREQMINYHTVYPEHNDWQVYQYKDDVFIWELIDPKAFKEYLDMP